MKIGTGKTIFNKGKVIIMKKLISMVLCITMCLSMIVSVSITASAYTFNHNGTATKKATAYRLPSVNSSDIWWVDKNDKLEVLCQDGDYYLVLYPFNNTGKHIISYVPTSAVSTSGVPKASSFYMNEIMIVTLNANLYHNPSTDKVIGASGSNQTVRSTVSKGQEVTVLFEKDGFYCVRTANDIGFIEKNKLTIEKKCEHTKTHDEVKSWEVSQKDDIYHTVTDTYDIYCKDCGELIKSNATKTYNEKHEIKNDKCNECSYTVPGTEASKCKHTNTVKHASEDMENGVQIIDNKKHTVFTYYNLYCTDCYTYVETNLPETYDEEHNFVNNVCSVCNLENLVDKPAASTISVNKNTFTPNEEISFSWTTAERATGYDLHIYKEGQESRYKLLSYNDIRSTSVKIADEGSYTAAIYSTNSAGYTGGANWVKFTVKKAFTEKTAWVYNTERKNLNMRSQTNTKSSIVEKIPADATITVTGDKTNNFYPVKYNGKSGYASATYITFTKPTISSSSNIASQLGKRIANVYNYPKGTSYIGECVWYVRGRASEKLGVNTGITGNGCQWYAGAKARGISTGWSVKSNSIACFRATKTNSYGHVIFVEEVIGNNVYYTEANVQKPYSDGKISSLDGVLKVKSISAFTSGSYQGCIYLK